MALTGETVAEAATRYDMSAMAAQRELGILCQTVRDLLRLARTSDTADDAAEIIRLAETTAGQDGNGNFKRINELRATIALDTQIAAGLRQLEAEGHANLLVSQMTAIVTRAKAACYDLRGMTGDVGVPQYEVSRF